MSNKTNKSVLSRIKLTKNGKMKTRALNQCHYNSQESNSAKMAKKKQGNFSMTAKVKSRFLPGK